MIKLAEFQLNAIDMLMKSMDGSETEIVLKSPTGSGKTIILTYFMDEYLKGHANTVFIWLTPGKGNLEEQSKAKMDKYIHNSSTKLLADIMTSGFSENDCCFINWEKLIKKGNNALKDSERTNFLEWIEKALCNGLVFKVIIDESHQNFTEKADTFIQFFKSDKIIRCSATPIINKNAKLIEVSEDDVIAEELIKKLIVINENFPQEIETDNETHYLLKKAYDKQRELRSYFLQNRIEVNPLIVVQLPNDSDMLLDIVQNWFKGKGITVENKTLAIWLSGVHENIENISENKAETVAVIIKQAVATGWDCPRAHILVKLRYNMDETFETQTIGRIRRMPEAKHYGNKLTDSCYLYTFDKKFMQGVKAGFGKYITNEKTIFLKMDYSMFTLVKQQRTAVSDLRDSRKALASIARYFRVKFSLSLNAKENIVRLESNGFEFSENIVRHTYSGKVVFLSELSELEKLSVISVIEPINTNVHGREYHNRVTRIGHSIGMEYRYVNTIIGKLFGEKFNYYNKILTLSPRRLYAFVINNFEYLNNLFKEAMAVQLSQTVAELGHVSEKTFMFPKSILFTYDSSSKIQEMSKKNVYLGYLSSAEPRSNPEKKFEKFCEVNEAVDWFYKNGDKGEEYFSIVYTDNANRQKLFYPDYILSVNGIIWIIETKGIFNNSGNSEDIDMYSAKKFEALKSYTKRYGLRGGFVRYYENIDELCICIENYSDDINSTDWKVLKNIFVKNKFLKKVCDKL